MASKILGKYPINPDLIHERSIGSFDPKLLTYFLEGDQEKTERRKELGKFYIYIYIPVQVQTPTTTIHIIISWHREREHRVLFHFKTNIFLCNWPINTNNNNILDYIHIILIICHNLLHTMISTCCTQSLQYLYPLFIPVGRKEGMNGKGKQNRLHDTRLLLFSHSFQLQCCSN